MGLDLDFRMEWKREELGGGNKGMREFAGCPQRPSRNTAKLLFNITPRLFYRHTKQRVKDKRTQKMQRRSVNLGKSLSKKLNSVDVM